MKALAILTVSILIVLISSCNQNSPSPAPAPAAPTPTPSPTSSLTATEAALVGDWIFDKRENYQSGSLMQTHTPSTITDGSGAVSTNTVYANSHMVLKSTLFNSTVSNPQVYNADYYSATSFSSLWYVTSTASYDQFNQASNGWFGSAKNNIITLNATTLTYQDWIPGQIPNGWKYYFHK
jgi:hypothetical protein